MHEFSEIFRALAWPIVVAAMFFSVLSQIKALIAVFSSKIDRASRVKIGRAGIELAEEIARGSIRLPRDTGSASSENKTVEFEALAREYDLLSIPDLNERVLRREQLADRLGALASDLKLPRSALSEMRSEGKLVALATLAVQKPMANDVACLEKASKIANFKFTRYRIVLGLLPALSASATGASTLQRIDRILEHVEDRPDNAPDAALQRLIDKTRELAAGLRNSLA